MLTACETGADLDQNLGGFLQSEQAKIDPLRVARRRNNTRLAIAIMLAELPAEIPEPPTEAPEVVA